MINIVFKGAWNKEGEWVQNSMVLDPKYHVTYDSDWVHISNRASKTVKLISYNKNVIELIDWDYNADG